jgi:hypothetical protein
MSLRSMMEAVADQLCIHWIQRQCTMTHLDEIMQGPPRLHQAGFGVMVYRFKSMSYFVCEQVAEEFASEDWLRFRPVDVGVANDNSAGLLKCASVSGNALSEKPARVQDLYDDRLFFVQLISTRFAKTPLDTQTNLLKDFIRSVLAGKNDELRYDLFAFDIDYLTESLILRMRAMSGHPGDKWQRAGYYQNTQDSMKHGIPPQLERILLTCWPTRFRSIPALTWGIENGGE